MSRRDGLPQPFPQLFFRLLSVFLCQHEQAAVNNADCVKPEQSVSGQDVIQNVRETGAKKLMKKNSCKRIYVKRNHQKEFTKKFTKKKKRKRVKKEQEKELIKQAWQSAARCDRVL